MWPTAWGHDRRYGIDPTKIKNDLGWYPETPFEKGIVLTIDWYLAHPDWMAHVTSGDYQKYYEQMYKKPLNLCPHARTAGCPAPDRCAGHLCKNVPRGAPDALQNPAGCGIL